VVGAVVLAAVCENEKGGSFTAAGAATREKGEQLRCFTTAPLFTAIGAATNDEGEDVRDKGVADRETTGVI